MDKVDVFMGKRMDSREAKGVAMELSMDLMLDSSPDELKPILLVPKVAHSINMTIPKLLDVVTEEPDFEKKADIARQVVTVMEEAKKTLEDFLRSKGKME